MADTDLEYSALPTTGEIETGDEVLLVRDGVPIRFNGILPTENGVADAVAAAESARDQALAYGSGTIKATWAEAAALTGQANGAIVTVVSSDTATHASVAGDYGASGGQTPNAGVFRYSTSLSAFVRIADLESGVAKNWAEGATAPGAAGTKSAKSWVNFLLADTGFGAVATDMLLGATSKIAIVATDLLLGATSKIAAVAADLALGAGSFIKRAPQAAIDAGNYAAAAAASAASIPPGVGQEIDGYGPPTSNIGGVGAFYYDLTNSVSYGPKTSAGWPAGIPGVRGSVPSTTRIRVDLRTAGATLPATQATVTRNSGSTDMLPSDPYTYSPTTYGNNVPVIRPGKGLLVFTRAQQLLANPGAPVAETITLPVGVHAVIAWGPPGSTYTSAAGTAVGTGYGSIAGDGKVVQYLTITTAGTVTFTPAGGIAKANVQYNPSSVNSTEAVPYIATQSIREADQVPAGSALLAAMQSTQGYLLMGISDVRIRNYGAPADILGLNNLGAWFVNTNSLLSMSDPAFHNTGSSLGNDTFANGATIGRTWDASATGTFGGGSAFETSHPFAYNNGVAVTAASLGGPKGSGNTNGVNILNGCIGWWEYDTTARLTDEALWNAYTSQPAPTLDSLLKNYAGATQFSKFLASVHQLRAGIIDHVKVGIIGPSHEGGVGLTGDTDIRSNSWASQMLADLETDGYSVAEAFCGTGSATFSGGTMKHDARITYTGTAPTAVDVDFGKTYVVIPAGTVLTFTPGRSNSRFIAYFYTDKTGRGVAEVSKDGGTTPIAANETGATSNSTTSATFTGSITGGVLTTTGTTGTIRVGDRLTRTTGVAIGTAILAQLSGTPGGDGTYSVSNTTTTTSASMSTKALIVRTYDTTIASNAWSIKAVGNPVHLCLCYAYNPAAKSFVFFNGGANGYNVGNLSLDDDVESSYAYPVRVLGCSLWFGCGDDTNDMNAGGTAWAMYNQQATAIITNAQLSGSVVLFTDPESTTTTFARALSDRITEQGRAVGWAANVPIYDFYAYQNSDPVKCQWDILNPNGAYNDTTHLSRRANKRFKSNQMRALFKRIVALA
jgi:hypothetical protein